MRQPRARGNAAEQRVSNFGHDLSRQTLHEAVGSQASPVAAGKRRGGKWRRKPLKSGLRAGKSAILYLT